MLDAYCLPQLVDCMVFISLFFMFLFLRVYLVYDFNTNNNNNPMTENHSVRKAQKLSKNRHCLRSLDCVTLLILYSYDKTLFDK